jgi:surface protein
MFYGCTGLTSVDLSGLTTLSGNSVCGGMFSACTSLATVYIGGTTAINFSTRINQFSGMFNNCTQNIDVYAPAASQTAIEGLTGYPNFGGTGTVTWHWRS